MKPEELKDILKKQAEGRLSPQQQQMLDEWYAGFDQSERNLKVFKDEPHEALVYNRLLQRIYTAIPVEQSAALVVRPRKLKLYQQSWFKIAAAVAFFTICISFYVRFNDLKTRQLQQAETLSSVKTENGKMMELTLEDGSVITLNAATKFRYPKHFTGSRREVYLEGEAFFKVTHNPRKPFIVHSGSLRTTVLGTSFNIRAYPGMDEIKVNVATGKVGVGTRTKTLGFLLPDQQISYHQKNNTIELENRNAALISSWRAGKVQLDGASFADLAVVIKNTYGYVLETQSREIKKVNFKTTFNSYDKIESVMGVISRIPDAKFRIKDKTITMY